MKLYEKTIIFSLLLGLFTLIIIFPDISTNSNYDTEKIELNVDKEEPRHKISEYWNNFTFIHIQDGNWSNGINWGWIQGGGSYSDPYRIENMTINATSSPTIHGIFINNTINDYFMIKNCTVFNAIDLDTPEDEMGIYLLDTNNGTLINNTCFDNFKGIFLEGCENSTIIDNSAHDNIEEGLVLDECSETVVIGNNVSNNIAAGMDLDTSTESIIIDNNINYNGEDGIEWEMTLEDPQEKDFFNTLISENEIIGNGGNGILIKASEDSIPGSTINYKWNNISGNIINKNDENGIAFDALHTDGNDIFYSNNTFSNNILSENGDSGISISVMADSGEIHFSYNNITDNIIIDSGADGIYFKEEAKENGKVKFFNNNFRGNNITSSGDNGISVDLNAESNPTYLNTEVNFNYNTLSNNIINKSGISGINLTASMVIYGNNNGNNNTIIGNTIIESRYYGIYLYGYTNSTISGNNMTKCGLGISFHQDSLKSITEITSNQIDITNLVNSNPIYYYANEVNLGVSSFSKAGQVILINCNNSMVSNLNVSYGSIGIMLHRCNNITISNNNASANTLYGISLEICYNNTLLENNVTYNKVAGINLYFCYDNNTLLGNNASYNKNYGIAVYWSNNTRISENNANQNENSGIYLYDSYHNNITGNTIKFNLICGIYLEICNYTFISGNTINENQDIGIYLLNSHNNTISDNIDTINDNANQGVYLENSDFNIISGNLIRFNDIGIYFLDSSNNTIINNDLRGNGLAFLEVGDSEGNIFDNNLIDTTISGGGGGGGSSTTVEGIPFETLVFIILLVSVATAVAGIVGLKKYNTMIREKEKEIEILKVEKGKLTQDDIIVTKENLLCVVHKGAIKGFTFVCPECGTFYCARCYDAVKKLENACWSCGKPLDPSKPIKYIDDKGKIKIKLKKEAGKPSSMDKTPKKAPKDFKAYKK